MKKRIALLTIAAAAAMALPASAASYTGDLVVGFTTQAGNDFLYDLGTAGSLVDGQSWNLSANLLSYDLNTVSWGVIGDKTGSPRTAWTTSGDIGPLTLSGNPAWTALDTATRSIYQNFSGSGSGQSLSITATDDNSWNQQTIAGTLTTQYHNAYENPNVAGLTSANFFRVSANGSDPSLLGSFSLDNSGTLTFAAVPEPSLFGLLAFGGILAGVRQSRSRSKQS